MSKGLGLKYFVLNPKSKKKEDKYASASRKAIISYANAIRFENRSLYNELKTWVDQELTKEQQLFY